MIPIQGMEDNHQELQDLLHTKEGDAGQGASASGCLGSSPCDSET